VRRSRSALLFVAALIAACASDQRTQDTRACRSLAARREVVQQGPGEQPAVLTTGSDEKLYQKCMNERGWSNDLEKPAP
jgi:hypothetical protein